MSRWFHYGLTSSDVGDTALALQLRDAGELILAAISEVERVALLRAEEFRHTPMIGRTHGVHAEPTTFGLKLLGWVTELRRQRERLPNRIRRGRGRQALGRGRARTPTPTLGSRRSRSKHSACSARTSPPR